MPFPDPARVERELLDVALEFYEAAERVIEYRGVERPRLRSDRTGLDAVRKAMGALAGAIVRAHDAGLSVATITSLTRLDVEVVERMLRGRAAAPSPDEG